MFTRREWLLLQDVSQQISIVIYKKHTAKKIFRKQVVANHIVSLFALLHFLLGNYFFGMSLMADCEDLSFFPQKFVLISSPVLFPTKGNVINMRQ